MYLEKIQNKVINMIFKTIKGYEGIYEVNRIGEVYSCERTSSDGKHLQRKKLKGGYFSNNYKFTF